jgi:hypothetical protein
MVTGATGGLREVVATELARRYAIEDGVTTLRAPGWIRITVGVGGGAGLVLSATCFLASDIMFGTDAFRTLARVPVGLLGAACFGIGARAIVVAFQADILVLQSAARALFLATALAPMVLVYNVGAFDQVDTAGSRTFALSALVIACVCVPMLLSLLVLHRIARERANRSDLSS